MCAQFTLKIQANELSKKYGIKVPENLESIDERYLPYKQAPCFVKTNDDLLKLTSMNFSLIPSWSKEAKVKFATHNARIETITEKPTWKIPFKKQHCLIPMTGFFESVYDGPLAGNIIEFSDSKNDLLFAAGIFDVWKNYENKQNLFSFSILTSEPSKFILDHGHDRCPIFLNFENAKKWLSLFDDDKLLVDFLLKNIQIPELNVQVDRPLKAGWEKRK